MPQMAPMNWLMLYFMFLMIYLIFIILNYYSFFYTSKIFKSEKSKMILTWKW